MTEEDYIKKWLTDTLSEAEKEEFSQTEAYSSIQRMDRELQKFKAPAYDETLEFDRLRSRLRPAGRQVRVNWVPWLAGAAAAITLLVVSYFLFLVPEYSSYTTGIAGKRTIVLPDSSLVILAAKSELRLKEDSWDNDRFVELTGEALFQVARGSDFHVYTETGTVSVLGTEFNVRDRTGFYEVICYEGKVAVKSGGVTESLTPGRFFRAVNGDITTESSEYYNYPHLLTNESAFSSVPVREVIAEFERHYDVKVIPENIDLTVRFTGRFGHDNLDLAIQTISVPLGLQYRIINDERIILTGE